MSQDTNKDQDYSEEFPELKEEVNETLSEIQHFDEKEQPQTPKDEVVTPPAAEPAAEPAAVENTPAVEPKPTPVATETPAPEVETPAPVAETPAEPATEEATEEKPKEGQKQLEGREDLPELPPLPPLPPLPAGDNKQE